MVQEILQNCIVEGMTVKLPPTPLDRKTYLEVAKKLELIGGKWKGGKIAGFVFQENPTELLTSISGGENINLKKQFQFFGTPEKLADQLVELAFIKSDCEILEPSAGQGAIIYAINRITHKMMDVSAYELMELNQKMLEKVPCVNLLGADFFTCTKQFDRIIANPPFSKNQDVDHIRKMYECLKVGGRIVTIASIHWQTSTNKKETAFKEWLDNLDAEVMDVEAGEFKESGTSIATCIIVIDK